MSGLIQATMQQNTNGKLSADAGSLLNKVKQASRPQVSLKTQPPFFWISGPATDPSFCHTVIMANLII